MTKDTRANVWVGIIVAALLGAAAVGVLVQQERTQRMQQAATTPTPTASAAPTDGGWIYLPDCEDGDITLPCVTWDEQRWRIVRSYEPYQGHIVGDCALGDAAPCVDSYGGDLWPVRLPHLPLER